jgi:small-conductance mechanosensitive channel
MNNWLRQAYWGNSVLGYLIAAGVIVLGIVGLQIIRSVVLNRFRNYARNTETDVDDFVFSIIRKSVLPLCYAGLVYFALRTLTLSEGFQQVLHVAIIVVCVFFIVRFVVTGVEYVLNLYLKKRGKEQTRNALRGLMIIVRLLLFTFGLIFLLDNLGYNVTTVLTGLGIGGIAIALAAQTILGDVFAYFAILFDRPFEVGDFLIVEGQLGTVSHIGIKTTRFDSLSGEQLAYANKKLTETWIHNYSRMTKRRAVFGFNVSYDTPVDKLEAIPGEVKKIITAQNNVALDRVHFAAFKESYLYFEAVYYSLSPDYGLYMDTQQAINLAIMRKFEEMGISFAFPSTTISFRHPAKAATEEIDRQLAGR